MIDRKEAIIKSLVKDLEEAEEQYQMAQRSHLQNEDRLIGEQYFSFILFICLSVCFNLFVHTRVPFQIFVLISSFLGRHSFLGLSLFQMKFILHL